MIDELIKWLVGFLCGSVVSLLGTMLSQTKKRKQRNAAMEEGVQALLRAEIIRSYEKYETRKFCPLYAREALRKEYNAYHLLGGNDIVTGLYDKIMDMPTENMKEMR